MNVAYGVEASASPLPSQIHPLSKEESNKAQGITSKDSSFSLDKAKEYFLKPFEFIQEAWNTLLSGKQDPGEVGKKLLSLPEPASHEARYTIEFQAEEGSDFANAQGEMTVEMVKHEGYWITKQTSFLRITSPEDDQVVQTSTFLSTLEDEEGLNYQFAAEAKTDDLGQENIQGRARLVSQEGNGTVAYDSPEEVKIALPAKTVFPIKHLKLLMDAANKLTDKSFQVVKALVFDGSSDIRNVVRIEAIITRVDPKTKIIKLSNPALHPERLWRAEMQIFTLDNTSGEPDYIITQVFSNQGILFEVIVDYGGYKMVSTLTDVKIYTESEALPALRFEKTPLSSS